MKLCSAAKNPGNCEGCLGWIPKSDGATQKGWKRIEEEIKEISFGDEKTTQKYFSDENSDQNEETLLGNRELCEHWWCLIDGV